MIWTPADLRDLLVLFDDGTRDLRRDGDCWSLGTLHGLTPLDACSILNEFGGRTAKWEGPTAKSPKLTTETAETAEKDVR